MKSPRCFAFINLLVAMALPFAVFAQAPGAKSYIAIVAGKGYFPLSVEGKAASIYRSENEYPGVVRAVKSLQADINAVTQATPTLLTGKLEYSKAIVLIGTVGKNELIDKLISEKKINVKDIEGKWEAHITQVVNNPLPGIAQALVIAGSDKRGTIYGIYDLSARIGVSPWYWWADVPIKQQKTLYVIPGKYTDGEPAVKYRGIFINDEAPSFSGWAKEKFGGVNHLVYEKMFELILRLKGNYLWPAMWGNAFNDDDKLDPVLADEYGIVMGTSHHEPMDRAQQEWKRYGKGAWNYQTNDSTLREFWKTGIKNMGTKETLVTIGMRGDGDMPMTEGSNIALLEKIVKDQRKIIADVTQKDTAATPQIWALYKEVQDYYDKGMRVPDDVTLLLCDDNWGNIRKLPQINEPKRKGGYGIYYHFDYVGDPRNYKWLNTNPISKVWEQMHLAYEYGADRVWVVNVGDLKPMEFPISFFLDYAWAPRKLPVEKLNEYTTEWSAQQFGNKFSSQIAEVLNLYTKYNGRRKPELLDQNTYSLTNYREFEKVVNDYNALDAKAEKLNSLIPMRYRDAFYQLVLYPVKACANLNELYFNTAKNRLYAMQGRSATNQTAAKVKALYENDSLLAIRYNKEIAHGKWNHMMDQTHIGYTYWQQPPVNAIPKVTTFPLPEKAEMGIAVEGSESSWPNNTGKMELPGSYKGTEGHYFELFNRGKQAFNFTINSNVPFVIIKNRTGKVNSESRFWVKIDWSKVPQGVTDFQITIKGAGKSTATIFGKAYNVFPKGGKGFFENNGYVSMEASHYSKAVNANGIKWAVIPDYGKTLSGVTSMPVTVEILNPRATSAHLEYDFFILDTGKVNIMAYIAPGLDFNSKKGLKYAISIDDEKPQIVNINADASDSTWRKNVANDINTTLLEHTLSKSGKHTLKYWMLSPGVVLQKLVIYTKPAKYSYLGPPESLLK